MNYAGLPRQATHASGHVLDLPFTNIPAVEALVARELMAGSDHLSLRLRLQDRGTEPKPYLSRRWLIPEDKLPRLGNLVRLGTARLPDIETAKEEGIHQHCCQTCPRSGPCERELYPQLGTMIGTTYWNYRSGPQTRPALGQHEQAFHVRSHSPQILSPSVLSRPGTGTCSYLPCRLLYIIL